jgi:anti-anti-sigma factor
LERRNDLSIDAQRDGAVGTLRLKGEIRADLVQRLHDAADTLRASGAHHLLVDLGGVTFVDSASVGELVRLDHTGAASGGRTVLFALPRVVRRVLDVTGLSSSVRTAADEVSARAALGA